MKKMLLFILILLLVFNSSLFSQKYVSTEKQYRNAVIEEFTGIHCGSCPSGHKIAKGIADDYPGRVSVVAIHTSSYSKPFGSDELDLRTDEGEDLADFFDVHSFPTAMISRGYDNALYSRGSWGSRTDKVNKSMSPVNIAAKAVVDPATRELTVEVECYFTDDVEENLYINVYLTQNYICGYQASGSYGNPGNVLPDGNYIHEHILRNIINDGDIWGDLVDETTKGTLVERTYTFDIPEELNEIPYVFEDLEVIAFIGQYQNEIYTATTVGVEQEGLVAVDMEITDKTEYPDDLCSQTINPVVEITNVSENEVTEFSIDVTINGETYTEEFSGLLGEGESTTIDWGDLEFRNNGAYLVDFHGFDNINNDLAYDINSRENNEMVLGFGFSDEVFNEKVIGFENEGLLYYFKEARGLQKMGSSYTQRGANNTNYSVMRSLYTEIYNGETSYIYAGRCEMSAAMAPEFSFYYAYGEWEEGCTAPEISVEVTTDCGVTWTKVYSDVAVRTADFLSSGSVYYPESDDFEKITIDFTDYIDQVIIVRMGITQIARSNAIFIDELTFGDSGTGVEDGSETIDLRVYPNPTRDILNINIAGSHDYALYNSMGQKIKSGLMENRQINTEDLTPGVYVLIIEGNYLKIIKI